MSGDTPPQIRPDSKDAAESVRMERGVAAESDRTEILGGGQTGREKQVEEIDRAGRAGSGDFNINDSPPLRSLFPPRYTALSKLLPPLTDFP